MVPKPPQSTFNVIEIEFANEAHDYECETIRIEHDAAMVAGEPIRKETMFCGGITCITQALRLGKYLTSVPQSRLLDNRIIHPQKGAWKLKTLEPEGETK